MMALPNGVTLGPGGRTLGVSQRGWWVPPLTSCMFAALDFALEHAGYITPLKRAADAYPVGSGNFVYRLHRASGAPLSRGTTTRESQRALRVLLPNAPVLFGSLTDHELLDALNKGAAIRIIVPNCTKLPRSLRGWVGLGYDKGHALNMIGPVGADSTIGWIDPLARPPGKIKPVTVPYGDV